MKQEVLVLVENLLYNVMSTQHPTITIDKTCHFLLVYRESSRTRFTKKKAYADNDSIRRIYSWRVMSPKIFFLIRTPMASGYCCTTTITVNVSRFEKSRFFFGRLTNKRACVVNAASRVDTLMWLHVCLFILESRRKSLFNKSSFKYIFLAHFSSQPSEMIIMQEKRNEATPTVLFCTTVSCSKTSLSGLHA